jgi:methylthioribulose-1-phosphate dehydratase
MSRQAHAQLVIKDFEMQKALTDIKSHASEISIPIFDNSQDMTDLVGALEHYLADEAGRVPGFLVRGHGLYAWGTSLDEAKRHAEGLEFLIECTLLESLK